MKNFLLIDNAVDESIFWRINATNTSKPTWNILKNAYEGASFAKLKTLRRKFENVKLNNNESVNEYITKIWDLFNQMSFLGEDIQETRMIEKILRSLMPKFEMFATSIMVYKYLSIMRIDEFSGYLLIVEEITTIKHM